MKIERSWTDETVLRELGERLCRLRLEKNWTQRQVATEAGVGLRTVQRLEAGQAGTQLSGFIRILRVLGLSDRWDILVPDQAPSPIAQLKMKSNERKRASRRTEQTIDSPTIHDKPQRVSENKTKWTWGE